MLTRREVLRLALGGALAGWSAGCVTVRRETGGAVVNDVQGQLNATRVRQAHRPTSPAQFARLLRQARERDQSVSFAGARHAQGGQQFGEDTCHFDLTGLNCLRSFDAERQLVEVEAGVSWFKFMNDLAAVQGSASPGLGVIQKQSGADELTLGGALAANVHGRGLTLPPIVENVESFMLLDAEARERMCSRRENPELFALVIGGYGLFGVITQVTLRLQPRYKVRRLVEIVEAERLIATFDRRIASGCSYGDFQYAIDPASDGYLNQGVLSCYEPVPDDTPMPEDQADLSTADWAELIHLAHHHPELAYQRYTSHVLSTHGQLHWSDTQQRSTYDPHYHERFDQRTQAPVKATDLISELYVPRDALAAFLRDAAALLRHGPVPVIYGNIRLIERDTQTFLAWARAPFACVIFNLHCIHTPAGIAQAKQVCRALIDLAIRYEGSYYLTYHRWARREQVEHCYPQFAEFLQLKCRHDPQERFQSDWYRHYRAMFA